MNRNRGFTIVELLVVIVVIGVLAGIALVSYTGISNQAIAASLKSDLTSAVRQLKMYQVDHDTYPSSLSTSGQTYCPTPSDNNYCLKASSDNTYAYSSPSPHVTFTLYATHSSGTKYRITHITSPVAVVIPPNTTDNGDGTFTTLIFSSPNEDGVIDYQECWGVGLVDPDISNTAAMVGHTFDTDYGCLSHDQRFIQKFDISVIYGSIISSNLKNYLYYIESGGGEDIRALVYHVPDFGVMDKNDHSTTPYGLVGAIATLASSQGLKTLNVTSQVNTDVSAGRQYSAFRTQIPTIDMWYSFYTSDNATNKPYLSITWN